MTENRARSLQENERLFLLVELQLLCMLGVIQAKREDGADFNGSEPDDLIFSTHASVCKQHTF